MFSVRLFIAVAGVLLMSDTAQTKATVRQSRSTGNPKSTEYLKAAEKENEEALKLIPQLPFRYEVYRESEINVLSYAQADLRKLLDNKATDRIVTLTEALFWEITGRFAGETVKERTKVCNETSIYVQRAMAKIIAATMKEQTDEAKKGKIRNLTDKFITEDGTFKGEFSEDDMYDMGWNVWEALGSKVPPF